MIEILDKHNCCGCEACVQVCPRHCISFDEDIEGFHYPLVDKTVCIDCGLCERVCPVLNQAEERPPLKVYAAKNKNEEELLASSSGGLFILFAKAILQKNGVVFGAKFDEIWNVVHSYAETEEGVKAFMGSKYVQSRIGSTYKEAKEFLDAGRQVLFSGTSCQIAGLKRYLRKEYDNLLTVDVICHGVPSPKVWRMYLAEIRRSARKGKNSVSLPLTHNSSEGDSHNEWMRITRISFRDKLLGWEKFSFALTLAKASADGKQNTVSLSQIYRENPYMRLFLGDYILRPSCYNCPSKSGTSCSDVTIADYWKIEKIDLTMYDEKGVGLLIVNTQKGLKLSENISFILKESKLSDIQLSNPSYYKSHQEPLKRNKCFQKINSNKCESIQEIVNQMYRRSLYQRVKNKIKKIIKNKLSSLLYIQFKHYIDRFIMSIS